MHFIVVDDNKLDCFIAEKVIQKTGRSESVKSFMVAADALDYIIKAPAPGIKTMVFVDIQMPLMNGFEFVEAFEQKIPEHIRDQYVVNLLSSSINEIDMNRAKGFKCVHKFLNKPLTNDAISAALEAA